MSLYFNDRRTYTLASDAFREKIMDNDNKILLLYMKVKFLAWNIHIDVVMKLKEDVETNPSEIFFLLTIKWATSSERNA